jgi:hypothetical protein
VKPSVTFIASALLAVAIEGEARAEHTVTIIEKATIPWSELERMLQGAEPARPSPKAPRQYSIARLDVSGEISDGRAQLDLEVEIDVLADRWIVAPLLPASFAVSSAKVSGPSHLRGILARDVEEVVFVAEGAGSYRVRMEVEATLAFSPRGRRLHLAPPGLFGGRASLLVQDAERIEGRTRWRTTSTAGGLRLEAALGLTGLDLEIPTSGGPPVQVGAGIDDLQAVTVVSIGGRGVTRLIMSVTPGGSGALELMLPEGAELWKAYVAGKAVSVAKISDGRWVRLPITAHSARVEIAYTFAAARLGIRGSYRVEMPRLPLIARAAAWELWLPQGLRYLETQSSLALDGPCSGQARAHTNIQASGVCFRFARAALEPGVAYVEGMFEQQL